MKTISITAMTFLSLFFLSACAHKNEPAPGVVATPKNPQIYSAINHQAISMIQTDRYTLVELDDPTNAYVLDQIIDTALPKNLSLTVKDGMEYVLNQSGYSLCHLPMLNVLYDKKLPKIHYKIGPVKLSDALQIMAGPAWRLTLDDVEREVCFKLGEGYEIKPLPVERVPLSPASPALTPIKPYEAAPTTIEITSPLSETKKLVESSTPNLQGKPHE